MSKEKTSKEPEWTDQDLREAYDDTIAEMIRRGLIKKAEPKVVEVHPYSACADCGAVFMTHAVDEQHESCPVCGSHKASVKLDWGKTLG